MNGTLLLRLSGPMQSWGTQSRFDVRDTGREPSKSGVIGLLCAALGRPRSEPVADLAVLNMAVRVDQEGRLERDYHTASSDSFYLVTGPSSQPRTVVSNRYYLADARFLVGLYGDSRLLNMLYGALQNPVWPLYLGRKAFAPGDPVWLSDGLWEGFSLWDALQRYPWLGRTILAAPPQQLRVVYDDANGPVVRNDHPISFAERKFHQRRVSVAYISMPSADEGG